MNAPEILVTGGTGSLGRPVVATLREGGRGVRVLSRRGRPGTVPGDLLTGEGLEQAVEGVKTVVHCASNPTKTRRVDVEGTERLLRAAGRAGVGHFVFISIVGVDRNPYFPYYRMKLEVERIVERSGIPSTILRATQFHEFVLRPIRLLDRLPVVPVPKGFLLQPIDTGEVADRLVELALSPPAGRVPDIGGPEIGTFADFARTYLEVAGRSRRLLEVPVPGRTAKAFREGAHLAPERKYGRTTWEEFLCGTVRSRSGSREKREAGVSGGRGRKVAHRGWLRGGLLLVAATTLAGSLWALPFLRSFYDDFPLPGWGWGSTLGPYDEHLVSDYGAMNLALSVFLVSAAVSLERCLAQVALLAYLAFATPHFFFHAAQTHHFSPFHKALQLGSLGLLVLLPVALLVLTTERDAHTRDEPALDPEREGATS